MTYTLTAFHNKIMTAGELKHFAIYLASLVPTARIEKVGGCEKEFTATIEAETDDRAVFKAVEIMRIVCHSLTAIDYILFQGERLVTKLSRGTEQ